jgi:hypothetical protein
VKSLGGGTSVLNITRYKATGENTMMKRIVLFLYYYKQTSEDNRIAMYQSLPSKWP